MTSIIQDNDEGPIYLLGCYWRIRGMIHLREHPWGKDEDIGKVISVK